MKKFFFSIFSNASTDSSRESNLHFHSTLMTRHSAMGKKALLSSSSLVTKPDDARRLEVDKLIRQIGLNIGPMTHNRKLLRGHQEAFTKQRIYWWINILMELLCKNGFKYLDGEIFINLRRY